MSQGSAAGGKAQIQDLPREPLANLLQRHKHDIAMMRRNLAQDGVERMDDLWLLRYLMASNVAKATKRVRAMLAWRKANNVDEITERVAQGLQPWEFPHFDLVQRYMPHILFFNVTESGAPYGIECVGGWDVSGAAANITEPQALLYTIYRNEYMKKILDEIIHQTGLFTRWVTIVTAKGCSLSQLSPSYLSTLKSIAVVSAEYYRETSGKVFLVETSSIFQYIWGLFNTFVAEPGAKRCEVLAGNHVNSLRLVIPSERLPVELGGRVELVD